MAQPREEINRYRREYRARNPQRTKAWLKKESSKRVAPQKEWRYRKQYGLTTAQVDAMRAAAKGHCPLCGKDMKGRTLNIDHDHKSGPAFGTPIKVRGVLCESCNRGLGFFNDDPELMEKAAAYIRHHKTFPS